MSAPPRQRVEIVGAGLAGLLAANMLARHKPTIFERQPSLPNNHSAVLRCKSGIVGDILGIPFRKVTMVKATSTWTNPVADALAYSFKSNGQYRSDRSIIQQTVTAERFVAPPNLIGMMADQLNGEIKFNTDYRFNNHNGNIVISTVPMPDLMRALQYSNMPEFYYQPGRNIHAQVKNCDAFVSLMIPHPDSDVTRISLTGAELIVECRGDSTKSAELLVDIAANELGIKIAKITDITEYRTQYQKILPIDDDQRKQFMHWATDRFSIFSLGRFATWRPHLQLDDLVNDVRKIEGWFTDRYAMARSR